MEGIDRRLRMVLLNDLYGQLMTDKRSEALRLYLEEDLSLAEIAQIAGVSRQAVHDAILRAERRLEGYESALGLLARRERRRDLLAEARKLAEGGAEEKERLLALLDEIENTD